MYYLYLKSKVELNMLKLPKMLIFVQLRSFATFINCLYCYYTIRHMLIWVTNLPIINMVSSKTIRQPPISLKLNSILQNPLTDEVRLTLEFNRVKWYNKFLIRLRVPQGSNLGPLFFRIVINDIVHESDINCLSYAYDLKIYTEVNYFTEYDLFSLTLRNIDILWKHHKL